MNGEDGEVIYIDFVTAAPLKPIIRPDMSASSHGKFMIALFYPAEDLRDRFVLIVAYALTGHDIRRDEGSIFDHVTCIDT